jgi:hypothetical protein
MIEAKDLRIGNNFQNDEGNILTCFGVAPVDDSDQFNIWYGNELGFILLEEEAKPIPLTEEWLIKFVYFLILTDEPKLYHIKSKLTNKINSAIYSKGGKFYSNFLYEKEIKYVHTLQNYYYFDVLTGEELTIKD